MDCKINFLEMLIKNEVLTLFSNERKQVKKENKNPLHLAQLKKLATTSQNA